MHHTGVKILIESPQQAQTLSLLTILPQHHNLLNTQEPSWWCCRECIHQLISIASINFFSSVRQQCSRNFGPISVPFTYCTQMLLKIFAARWLVTLVDVKYDIKNYFCSLRGTGSRGDWPWRFHARKALDFTMELNLSPSDINDVFQAGNNFGCPMSMHTIVNLKLTTSCLTTSANQVPMQSIPNNIGVASLAVYEYSCRKNSIVGDIRRQTGTTFRPVRRPRLWQRSGLTNIGLNCMCHQLTSVGLPGKRGRQRVHQKRKTFGAHSRPNPRQYNEMEQGY